MDYEKQKSYSLSLEAKDGGGRVTTVSLLVSLTDVNDNPPVWEMTQYQRTVREGATNFQPQFFIRVSFSLKKMIVCIFAVRVYDVFFLCNTLSSGIRC